nr:SDR family NAD(P)-dependent oxidoreductase [Wolbachia endosymbiont of Folsomia candida]
MHEAGAILCISGTKKEVLEEVAKKYEKNIHVLPCDLSNSEEVSQLITKASELMEGFDGLICNAGSTNNSFAIPLSLPISILYCALLSFNNSSTSFFIISSLLFFLHLSRSISNCSTLLL